MNGEINNKSGKTSYWKYGALYFFTYMAIGSFLPLIAQYMDGIGFSGTQIGRVTATGTAVAMFAAMFWGSRYNSAKKQYRILVILCLAAAAVCLALFNVQSFLVFLGVFGVMYFFQAPIMSLSDAFVVENTDKFEGLRAWGSVGYGLGVFLAGQCTKITSVGVIFYFYIICFAIAGIVIIYLGRTRGNANIVGSSCKEINDEIPQEDGEDSVELKGFKGYLKVLGNKKLMMFILCTFFIGGTSIANNTYFSFLYTAGGGTVAGVGVAMLLMVGSEVPVMAHCEKITSKFQMEKVVLVAMLISATRFILFGLGLPWWMLIILSFTQGLVNGIVLVEFVKYVVKLSCKGYESLGISFFYVVDSNLSTIACQLVGGTLLDKVGATGVYIFFALFNLCGAGLYVAFKLHRCDD